MYSGHKTFFEVSLTINSHRFLHKIFIHKTADFATIHSAEFCSWIQKFDSSMFSKLITASNFIIQINAIMKYFTNGLRSVSRQPLEEGLRIISEKPFDINLLTFSGITEIIVAIQDDMRFGTRFDHFWNFHVFNFYTNNTCKKGEIIKSSLVVSQICTNRPHFTCKTGKRILAPLCFCSI